MVNIGTPSRACKTCKQRRIKCDQTRPFCQRCAGAGRTCPGVPEETDVLFRNQTFSTGRKAKNDIQRSSSSSSSSSRLSPGAPFKPLAFNFMTNLTFSPPSTSASLKGSRDVSRLSENSAVLSWFQSFDPSNGQDQIYANPCMEIVRDIFTTTQSDSPIYLALTANAMRAMCSSKGRREMQSDAATLYGRALSMCKTAINDPKQAKDDETLLGTVVMSWYESQAIGPASLESYNNHVRGTITLLRLRGRSQFSNNRSLRVFQAIRWQLIIHCIQRAIPIDTTGAGSFWVDDRVSTNDVIGQLYSLAIHIPALRACSEKLYEGPDDSFAVMDALEVRVKAQELDERLNTWFENLPAEYQYKTVVLPSNLMAPAEHRPSWRGVMFQYESYYCSMIVNFYRIMRLYLQSVVSSCLEVSKYDIPTQHYENIYSSVRSTSQIQVDGICSTVPFHLGFGRESSKTLDPSSARERSRSPKQGGAEQFSLAGFYLLLPLCVCTHVASISETQQRWLRNRIAALTDIGYKQARSLSKSFRG